MPGLTHEDLVRQLMRPEAYPGQVSSVGLVQTHISSLFFTDKHVYKVKRPVNYGFLDFTTEAKRRYYCHKEVALNRRLSPEVYLGVVNIVERGNDLLVEAPGEPVEYAVKMKQLPADRMMDRLLARGEVTKGMVERVAEKLADFHAEAETNEVIGSFGNPEMIRVNVKENFDQTEKYIGICLSAEEYQQIGKRSYSFLDRNPALFRWRIRKGRVRDCHGDVHSAHVCFEDGIYIYDCIEFNDRFRYGDVAAEVAFLAMDLDFHNRPDLSQAFVQAYVRRSGDEELMKLLDFYKCYRAYVRGKVASFQLDDSLISEEEKAKALATAKSYFGLAKSYTSEGWLTTEAVN